MTQEEFDAWMAMLRPDFAAGAAEFVQQMFIEKTDAALRYWVAADMSAAPPEYLAERFSNRIQPIKTRDN